MDIEESGAVYPYHFDGVTWRQEALLSANNALDFDYLGTSIAIDARGIFVGAPDHDQNQVDVGAVYYFAISSARQSLTTMQAIMEIYLPIYQFK